MFALSATLTSQNQWKPSIRNLEGQAVTNCLQEACCIMAWMTAKECKRPQPSYFSHDSSKKSLADFSQMVDYCESSGCRRKKILESFGEQVSESLCQKSCDACKHPNLVSAHIGELGCVRSIPKKSGPSPIFIKSSYNDLLVGRDSEFWNRDDEAHFSNEDISDSDDEAEVIGNVVRTMSSNTRLDEKIEYLERAEELYYQNKGLKKQANDSIDKKVVSELLREASKKRLLNGLKQAQDRLGNKLFDFEASATFLEIECFRKYGTLGKTFYNSQVAGTVRWLSSSTYEQIRDRLRAGPDEVIDQCTPGSLPNDTSPNTDHGKTLRETANIETQDDVQLEHPYGLSQMEIPREKIDLPPIPSFSEFVSQKVVASSCHYNKPNQCASASEKKRTRGPGKCAKNTEGKRMRQ